MRGSGGRGVRERERERKGRGYLSVVTCFIAENQQHEQQISILESQVESVTSELGAARTQLEEQDARYELLKEKAQKKLHEMKKQLDEKTALLTTSEQVSAGHLSGWLR